MIFLPLDSQHDRKNFNCGNAELNKWLLQVAKQHINKSVSKTFVAVESEDSSEVLGYYSITVTELINTDLPSAYHKRLPLRVPAFRLGRLAVSKAHQSKRIGESLLFDAIDRVMRISADVGGVGLVVNAKTDAVDFYKQYGFEVMADHPLNLYLPL